MYNYKFMSLALNPLRTIKCLDPRVMISNERTYAILEGGSQVSFKQYSTTSVANDTIQFSCPPPSPNIIVNRKVYFTLPVRLAFFSNAPNANNLIRPRADGPRAYPIANSLSNIAVTINNTTVTLNTSDVIQSLLRYNTGNYLKTHDYSLSPSTLDQSQNYSDLYTSNRSPLQFYADTADEVDEARSGFPFTIVVNTPSAAVIDMVLTEEIYLPPFYWGCGNMGGFIGVQTMDFNINFLGATPYRMWSHDAVSNSGSAPGAITSAQFALTGFTSIVNLPFSYAQQQPILNFEYITPKELQTIPRSVTYPYFVIDRYPTPFGTINSNAQATISSNNIQLNSIPRRMYIACRPDNSVLYANPNTPDSFAAITGISVNWANNSGLLSSASQYQLYLMSLKNHCNQSWTQWSGGPVNLAGVFPTGGTISPPVAATGGSYIGACCGPLCIEFGTDIGLGDSEAPGQHIGLSII